ncbi:hypothetical protein GGH19_004023 [Coemansia sp. RSA 1807]|nr:hypothetical protein LPJ54_002624 [Coemansia sp. RSA 1824]KAJ2118153.1 hypothetical protein GGH17_005870 [Coemansia sp. RSA 788]KAJ2130715.1 hypothetical protein GGF48_001889 [Coemansia sp. RSA 921]KAJ2156514.1 hypothetical protein GGH16_005646 [Coemansia sp. RSA 560]KAJ2180705.1 hypothetical protein GGF45_001860 [Coemansia sp. RSA 551]KAJ2207353.1 hypothetical protein EV180_006989 [Coemansia sp. RSA 518]KAJ2250668.1 hypothetical protein GGH97_000507 [Coemansia sp. RSA 475]KAJ2256916.1 hy
MDRQTEERRDYLYNNLSKQLTRLNQNFEQLNHNINVLKTQTEQSQRLAVFHAATFMGAKTVFSRDSSS